MMPSCDRLKKVQKKKKDIRAEAEVLKAKMMDEDKELQEASSILENDYDEDRNHRPNGVGNLGVIFNVRDKEQYDYVYVR